MGAENKQSWICPACGMSRERGSETCPACGKAARAIPDWKKPLYEYAVGKTSNPNFNTLDGALAMLTLLGDYQDARAKAIWLTDWRQKQYDAARRTALESNDSGEIRRAAEALERMRGFADSAAAAAQGRARIPEIEEREQRRAQEAAEAERRRERAMKIRIAAIAAAVVLIAVAYFSIVPPIYIRKGDQALTAGQYEEAIRAYDFAGALFGPAKARDKASEAAFAWADALAAEGDYAAATKLLANRADTYEEKLSLAERNERWGKRLNDLGRYDESDAQYKQAAEIYASQTQPEDEKRVYITWGDTCMARGSYETAVKCYRSAKEDDKYHAAYIDWGDALMAQGEYGEAIDKYTTGGDDNKKKLARAALGDAQLAQGDYEAAVKTFKNLKDEDRMTAAYLAWGDALLSEGNYAAAVERYGQAKAPEKQRAARLAWGDALYGKGEFRDAANKYEQAEAAEKARDAFRTWADERMEAGDLKNAVEGYSRAGDAKMERNARLAWSDSLAAEGNYSEAANVLEMYGSMAAVVERCEGWANGLFADKEYGKAVALTGKLLDQAKRRALYDQWAASLDGAEQSEDLLALMLVIPADDMNTEALTDASRRIADAAVETVLSHDAGGGKDCEFARTTGEAITIVDAQLAFCRGLHEAGYDLAQVYPEGVSVTNVPLGRYQIDELADRDANAAGLDLSGMLLFERVEKPYEGKVYPAINVVDAPHDRRNDANYTVRLLPGTMFSTQPDRVPERFADATCIVLLDCVYLQSNSLTHEESTRRNYGISIPVRSTTYYCYSAVDSLAAYDVKNPKNGTVAYIHNVMPNSSDDEWFNAHKGSSTSSSPVLQRENRIAAFDTTELRENLASYYAILTWGLF